MSEEQKKVFFYLIPLAGHVNPIFPLVKELSRTCKVTVFIGDSFRAKFAPIRGIEIKIVDGLDTMVKAAVKMPILFAILRHNVNVFNANCKKLMSHIDSEQPDLIIRDDFGFYSGLLLQSYKKLHDKSQGMTEAEKSRLVYAPKNRLPPLINFFTSLAPNQGVFPNSTEKKKLINPSFEALFELGRMGFTSLTSSSRNSTSIIGVVENDAKNQLLYSAMLSPYIKAIQPRNHLYDEKFRFVGPLSESRHEEIKEPLIELLAKFPEIEDKSKSDNPNKLIYVSCGTIFNNNPKVYRKIVDAFAGLSEYLFRTHLQHKDTDERSAIKSENLTVIISAGPAVMEAFADWQKEDSFLMPANIVLVDFAPQIAILKRASLFITHCGMNSITEAIHHGVPIIGIPVTADQPVVAYRICDELGLGIRCKHSKLTPTSIQAAVYTILSEKAFAARMHSHSLVSRKSRGLSDSVKLCYGLMGYEESILVEAANKVVKGVVQVASKVERLQHKLDQLID